MYCNNTIINSDIDSVLNEEKNSHFLKINFIFIIFYGVILVILILLNLGKKKLNFFYLIISWIYSLNNNLQFQIFRSLLYNKISEIHFYYSIPYSHAAVVIFFTLFIDSNYLINSSAFFVNLAIIYILKIGADWSKLLEFFILIIALFCYTYTTYLFDKKEKEAFFIMTKLDESLEKTHYLLQNLSLGYINLRKDLTIELNSKIIEILDKIYNINKIGCKNTDTAIKIFLFTDIVDYNKELKNLREIIMENDLFLKTFSTNFLKQLNEEEIGKYFSNEIILNDANFDKNTFEVIFQNNFDKLLKKLFDNIKNHKFQYLWKIKKNLDSLGELTFKIFIRYNPSNDSLEFLLNDMSNELKSEEKILSDKFKNEFVEQLLNEVAGPLIQIYDSISFIFDANCFNYIHRNNTNNQQDNKSHQNPINNNNFIQEKVSHLNNIRLLIGYINFIFFKLKSQKMSSKKNSSSFFPQPSLEKKKNGNKNDCVDDEYNNDNGLKLQDYNLNNKISSNKISINKKQVNLKNSQVGNIPISNRNQFNYMNINLIRSNTPGINLINDLSNSDTNILLNENFRKHEFINSNTENDFYDKNSMENKRKTHNINDNQSYKNINKQHQKNNLVMNENKIIKNDRKNIMLGINDLNSSNLNCSKIIETMYKNYLYSNIIQKRIKINNNNSDICLFQEKNYHSDGYSNNQLKEKRIYSKIKDDSIINNEKNDEIQHKGEFIKILKRYKQFFGNMNYLNLKNLKYKITLHPSEESCAPDKKNNNVLKNNPNNVQNHVNHKHSPSQIKEIVSADKLNLNYVLFFIFSFLNNFLKSGIITISIIWNFQNDDIKINVELHGIRDFESDLNILGDNIIFSSSKNETDNINLFENNGIQKATGIFNQKFLSKIHASDKLNLNNNMAKDIVLNINNQNLIPASNQEIINPNKNTLLNPQKASETNLFLNPKCLGVDKNQNLSPNMNRNLNVNKFTFNNFGEKNISLLSESKLIRASIISNIENKGNNYIPNNVNNNFDHNNSFLTKNIFSNMISIDNNNINNKDNFNNNVFNFLQFNARTKELEIQFFEPLRQVLADINGDLMINYKENLLPCLTITLNKKQIFHLIKKEKNYNSNKHRELECFTNDHNYFANNKFLIKVTSFKNMRKLNTLNNNIFKLIFNNIQNNGMNEHYKKTSSKNDNHYHKINSKKSTCNLLMQNFPKSFFSQDILEEILFKPSSKEFIAQNINNNNYFNNYNIINTYSEPNLKKTKTTEKKRMKSKRSISQKRCLSNNDRGNSKYLQQIMYASNSDMSDYKFRMNLFHPFNKIAHKKSNTSKLDDLENLTNKRKFTNSNLDNFKDKKSLFKNKTENSKFLRSSKKLSLDKKDKIHQSSNKGSINKNKDKKINTQKDKNLNVSSPDSSISDSSYTNISEIDNNLQKKINRYTKNIKNKNNFNYNNITPDSNMGESDLSESLDQNKNQYVSKEGLTEDKSYKKIEEYNNYVINSELTQNIITPRDSKSDTKKASIKILLVEDDQFTRTCQLNLIKKFFEKYSVKILIEECEDGSECLFKIFEGLKAGLRYDIIITDEKMMLIDGVHLATIIKNLKEKLILYDIKLFLVSIYEEDSIYDVIYYSKLFSNLFVKIFPRPLMNNNLYEMFIPFGYN